MNMLQDHYVLLDWRAGSTLEGVCRGAVPHSPNWARSVVM